MNAGFLSTNGKLKHRIFTHDSTS